MKKLILVMTLVFSMMMMSGCVNTDITIDLDKDGSMKSIIEVLGPKQIFEYIPEDKINELKNDFEKVEKIDFNDKLGYKLTTKKKQLSELQKEYSSENMTKDDNEKNQSTENASTDKNNMSRDTNNISKDTNNISKTNYEKTKFELPNFGDVKGSISDIALDNIKIQEYTYKLAKDFYKNYVDINEQKSLFTDTYSVNLRIKDAIDKDMSSQQKVLLSLFGKSSTFGIHLKSPIEMKSSNATNTTKEDGKYVYSWDYYLDNIDNISFTVDIPNVRNIIIAIASAILLIIAMIVLIIKRRRTKLMS